MCFVTMHDSFLLAWIVASCISAGIIVCVCVCVYAREQGRIILKDSLGNMSAMLGRGAHFGERAVTGPPMRRGGWAVALAISDVLILNRRDLSQALMDYPDSSALVKVS